MTPEDKAYYSDGYYPLFKLMSEEFGLTLLEQDMTEIMECVRKMDEARRQSEITHTKDYAIFRGKRVYYKDVYSVVVQVPHSLINYFELRPVKYLDDIGNGCGRAVQVYEKDFFENIKQGAENE